MKKKQIPAFAAEVKETTVKNRPDVKTISSTAVKLGMPAIWALP